MIRLEQVLVYLIVTATTVVMLKLGTSSLKLRRDDLRSIVGQLLECLGVSLVFLAVNVSVGIVCVFVIRTVHFIGLYTVADQVIVGFSILQGIVFQHWWRRSRG